MRSSDALSTSVGMPDRVFNPGARVEAGHRADLFHHDRRLLRKVPAEQRRELLGELGAIDLTQICGRHDQLGKGVPPHLARADSHAERRRQHCGGET